MFAYVSDSTTGDVYVVDLSSDEMVAIIPITGGDAFGTAATPDGSKVYASSLSGGTVTPIVTATNIAGTPITGFTYPAFIAASPDGSTMWVSDYLAGSVTPIDVATDIAGSPVTVGTQPSALAITPDGTKLYVCNSGDGTVTPVTLPATPSSPITVGSTPFGIAITPDGTQALVSNGDGTVTVITVTDDTVAATWTVGGTGPITAIAITPDGSTAYVAYSGGNVYPVDISTGTPGTPIDVATPGYGIAIDPTGTTLYVPNGGSGITPIDIATNTAGTPIPVTGSSSLVTIALAVAAPVALTRSLTTTVVAGPPPRLGARLTPTRPTLVPGPFGNHEYEVICCDKYGIATSVIPSAVVTEIDYELDSIGAATIDIDIEDVHAQLYLPMSSIPGVVEIQIWRDQALIWWGWPTGATWDAVQVHLSCQGLLWPLSRREFGPGFRHYLVNPQFEMGLADWVAVNCLAFVDPITRYVGKQAARLFNGTVGADAFLEQDFVVDCTDIPSGLAFSLSAYFYIDANYPSTGTALGARGLFVEDSNGVTYAISIDTDTPYNTWTPIAITSASSGPAFVAVGGEVTTYNVRLYCPEGSIVWDAVNLSVFENVSSPPASPPATAWDVADIMEAVFAAAQSSQWGQSDLNYFFWAAPTGVLQNVVYDVTQSEVILDALNVFPSTGVCDFEMIWDDTGHFRGMVVSTPSQGSVKYNNVLDVSVNTTTTLAGAVDGTQVGTRQRVLGQGSGPSQDTGYAEFASYLGGRVVYDAALVSGSAVIDSATINFTADDVGVNCYSLNGGLPPNTFIVSVTSATEAVMSNTALLTLPAETFGVGGITLDTSTSAIAGQELGVLQQFAESLLIQQMASQVLPAPKVRADGPNGMFGLVQVGDVIPVSADYGWLQIPPTMMRIAKLALYPPTEELEFTLMPLNTWVTPS